MGRTKGIMSLEVIIGFVILLVVAAVVISLLFTIIKPKDINPRDTELIQMEFKNKCQRLCSNTDTVDYCRTYFQGGKDGVLDWDGDGIEKEIVEVGSWDVCEDRIYCFIVVPCPRFGSNPIEGCSEALCKTYLRKYEGNTTLANEAVFDKIKPGTCGLENEVKDVDNWYKRFFPSNVCG